MHIKRIKKLLRQFHHEAMTSEKYEIAILADLEEALEIRFGEREQYISHTKQE